MAWDYRPEEEQEQEKKEKKERKGVSRREFYICFVILLAVLIWRTGALAQSMRTQENNAEYILQRLDDVSSQVINISAEVAEGVERANSPIGESYYEITDVDWQERTATLRFTATPKQYQAGATSMRFFLSCDGGEPMAIDAAAGENRIFTAEKEIPFCSSVSVTAAMRLGDTEYTENLGEMNIEGYVYPYFSGYFSGTYQWAHDATEANVSGEVRVDVTASDWMQNENQSLELKNPRAELYLDGKRLQSVPMEVEMDEFYWKSYVGELEDEFRLKEGHILEVIFKAEDADGTKYTYLLERTHILQGDIRTEEPGDGQLTVE